VSYEKLGDLDRSLDAVRARGLYQQSLEIRKKLAALEPDNTTFLRDLSVSYLKLGLVSLAEAHEEGRQDLVESIKLAERRVILDPGNPDGRQLLGAYFGLFDQMAEGLGEDFMGFVRKRQEYWSGR
jgi:hypothetical protein